MSTADSENTIDDSASTTKLVAEAKPMAEASPGRIGFLATLPKLCSADQIKRRFRLLSSGVFVAEDFIEPLVGIYQGWLAGVGSDQAGKGDIRLRHRLLGEDHPKLHYLVEGNLCLAGYLLPLRGEVLVGSPIPRYQASLLDASNFLHPKDPKLQSLAGLKIRSSRHGQFLDLSVSVSDRKVAIPLMSFADVVKLLRTSPQLLRRYPELAGPLREAVGLVSRLLQQAEKIPDNKRQMVSCVVAEQRSKGRRIEIYRTGTVYFIVDAGDGGQDSIGQLIQSYEISKRSVIASVRRELSELSGERAARLLKGARLINDRSPYFLAFRLKRLPFKMHLNALSDLLAMVQRSRHLRKRLPQLYTAWDLLQLLLNLFRSSKPDGQRTLMRLPKSGKLVSVEYRVSGEWRFQITEGKVVYSIRPVPRRSAEGRPSAPAAQKTEEPST